MTIRTDVGPAPEVDPDFLLAWKTLEDSGRWRALVVLFDSPMGRRAELAADPALAGELSAARGRIAEALEHERIHGHGSLLVHDHPFNVRMMPVLEKLRRARLSRMAA